MRYEEAVKYFLERETSPRGEVHCPQCGNAIRLNISKPNRYWSWMYPHCSECGFEDEVCSDQGWKAWSEKRRQEAAARDRAKDRRLVNGM